MEENTSRSVIDAILFENGDPLGVVQLPPDRLPQVTAALRSAGIEVGSGTKTGDHEYEVGQQCDVDNPRPCELTITLGRVQELGREAGVDTGEIDALETAGSTTDAQAAAAVEAVLNRMPAGDVRQEAALWRDVAFGGDSDG